MFSSAETATVTDCAVTRIRTWVVAATTRSTNHYTITAERAELSAETATVTDYAVTRIRTWVVAATTRSTNHYTITAERAEL
ncbi:hypothetical protein DPMN_119598 [Dreissena polymorpha]|uniref:Uncharacterized protein n=1 Tax=Dreissena polymorpha TaxID=45954 RepID=A0A9D4JRE1_DREPO|nr:hypothetical protein DPMN_119598 [Dreissena polymorpha]